ncbi:MAG: hypothetical protein MZV64_60565 [Ignavibacteriales bacterium]|nr:hypothetical protein [Ignavibacteriales bacterium]
MCFPPGWPVGSPSAPVQLQFNINGTPVGTFTGPSTTESGSSIWRPGIPAPVRRPRSRSSTSIQLTVEMISPSTT